MLFSYNSSTSSPQNVVQLSVHMASMFLDLTVRFLERIIGAGATPDALDALSSSFLMSNLLPNILAQLGPIAAQQPKVQLQVHVNKKSPYSTVIIQ